MTADSAVDGVYTYSGLASGSAYNYTVSQSAGAATDYAPASGVITIGKADVARTITLQPNRYDMTFTLTPAEAVLEVKDSAGEPLSPTEEAGLTYSVTNGSYTYNAQAFGYKTLEDSVVIDKAGQEVAIVLEEQDSQQVTFVFDPAGQDIQNRSLTVTAQLEEGAKTMTPDEDGGLTYTLPVGYRYQYVFRASNYAKQTGEIDLTAAAGGAQQQQTISLAPKTAWEGADDIETPSQEEEVYQIANGAQLAWLAQEVNAGRGGNYQAVLTADIDLGGEEWTPIGTLNNPFKGSFDGQGYTVKNLSILSPTSDNLGLFGYVNGGTVRNLTVAGSIQTSKNSVGGVTGLFTGNLTAYWKTASTKSTSQGAQT